MNNSGEKIPYSNWHQGNYEESLTSAADRQLGRTSYAANSMHSKGLLISGSRCWARQIVI